MPAIALWIGRMLVSVAGQVVLSALVAVGIGFAGTKVLSVTGLGAQVATMLQQAGPLYDYVGFFGIDKAMTILLSAWAGRMVTDAARVHLTRLARPS